MAGEDSRGTSGLAASGAAYFGVEEKGGDRGLRGEREESRMDGGIRKKGGGMEV